MENEPDLLRMLTGNPNTSQGPSSQHYDMSDDNKAALLKVFFDRGKSLYSKLFLEGDKNLAVLAKALDDYEPVVIPTRRCECESKARFHLFHGSIFIHFSQIRPEKILGIPLRIGRRSERITA
jgi:hypothetical protein